MGILEAKIEETRNKATIFKIPYDERAFILPLDLYWAPDESFFCINIGNNSIRFIKGEDGVYRYAHTTLIYEEDEKVFKSIEPLHLTGGKK